MRILLTDGTGFIGSHVAVSLIDAGYKVVCFDNLSSSMSDVAERHLGLNWEKSPARGHVTPHTKPKPGDPKASPPATQTLSAHGKNFSGKHDEA